MIVPLHSSLGNKVRHSVRAYEDRPLDAKVAEDLKVMIQQCNREGAGKRRREKVGDYSPRKAR